MKSTIKYSFLAFIACALLFSSCFSPWTGEETRESTGSITVTIGSSSGGRAANWPPPYDRYIGWDHEVILKDTSNAVIESKPIPALSSPFSATFSNVLNGNYIIEIWATDPWSSPPNEVMAVGSSPITVAGGPVSPSITMESPIYIEPNNAAHDRYIYWDGLPNIQAKIHELIMNEYSPFIYNVVQNGAMFSSTPTLSGDTISISLTSLVPTDYGDDFYVELAVMGNSIKSNRLTISKEINSVAGLSALSSTIITHHILTSPFTMPNSVTQLPTGITFDGNGNTITFNSTSVSVSFFGLFGTNNGTIQNLKVISSITDPAHAVTGSLYLGAVAGRNNGTIQNVSATVTINVTCSATGVSTFAGGIAGINNDTIKNCYVDGAIAIDSGANPGYTGGIAGENNDSIKNCWAEGTVMVDSTNSSTSVGGIASSNLSSGNIANCVALQTNLDLAKGNGSGGALGNIVGIDSASLSNNHVSMNTHHRHLDSTLDFHATVNDGTLPNGLDISSGAENTDTWWKSTLGWYDPDPALSIWGGADEDHPWKWGSSRPKLWFEP